MEPSPKVFSEELSCNAVQKQLKRSFKKFILCLLAPTSSFISTEKAHSVIYHNHAFMLRTTERFLGQSASRYKGDGP